MNEGALTLTSDGTILYANHCFAKMLRAPLEQVIGKSFLRFLPAEELSPFQTLLTRTEISGLKSQVMLAVGDGSQLPAQISIRPLAGNGAAETAFGMVVTDLTEARRLADQKETERLYLQVREQAAELERRVDERTGQLLLANQELEAFESSVSHDLRGPLRHIAGYSEALIEELGPAASETSRNYLDKIRDSTGKMNQLIEALLDFSRLSKRVLALQPVDVGRMWHEILAEMRPELGERKVEVSIGELPPCSADPTLLRQVIVNLLGNALKYSRTRDRSVIEISTLVQPGGGSPAYSIKDNGVGFDMAHAHKLFAVFERLHCDSEFEGTGVGLNTVHRIIQRHGGRIWAESTPGAGATFFFTVAP
jgi:PAS domain S-box-containing protein